MKRLCIVADENIIGLDRYLGNMADITYLPGRAMTVRDVKNVDALLVRSVTTVNENLIKDSSVRFVGSCTIGTDHIDLDYLEDKNIAFANAPGCNADAVVDYVLANMFANGTLAFWQSKRVLVVGLGQVGSRLVSCLQRLGISVKISDPFLPEHNAGKRDWFEADMISLHVPLTHDGEHPTFHLLNESLLHNLKDGVLLINSCRGKVVDNQVLLALAKPGKIQAVLDVYEDEPEPKLTLLEQLSVCTGHIAGYSKQGKLRGTEMVVSALRDTFSLDLVIPDLLVETTQNYDFSHCLTEQQLVCSLYDVETESQNFLANYRLAVNGFAEQFDQYRKNYAVRNEFSFSKVRVASVLEDFAKNIRLQLEE